jgi:predicted lipid-binding transport protein (Tim44 family)
MGTAGGSALSFERFKREARTRGSDAKGSWRVRNDHLFKDITMTTAVLNTSRPFRLMSVALVCGLSVAACTDSQGRVAAGGAIGALAGGAIGYAVGGTRGALVGAAIGGVTGLVIADAIEQQRMREATLIAARSGGGSTQSFRNSKGEAVVIRTRTVRTYTSPENQRVRVIERSVSRNGQAAGSQQVEAKETKLASGGTEWVAPE